MIILLVILISYCTFILVNAKLFVNNTLFMGWQFLAIYIITLVLFLMKYRRKTLLNPEFLFSIVFLSCTFLYLPLLFNSNIDTFIFGELANESNVNLIHSQSIAVMSFLFYLLGAVLVSKRKIRGTKLVIINRNDRVLTKNRRVLHYLTTALISFSTLSGGYKIIFRYRENSVGLNEIGGLFQYITIFLVITSVLEFLYLRRIKVSSLKSILKHIDRLYLLNLLFMSSLYIISGYRSALFPIVIPVVFLYDIYIKKISKIVLISMLVVAFVLMSVMKDTRTGRNVIISENIFSLQYLNGDFISANKAMYFLIDHTDKYGSQKGQNAIMQMVAFIPFAQSTLINLFGIDPTDSSSRFFTDKLGATWSGLGTHVIGDLYYSFGLFGTLFWMFLIGLISNILYAKSTNRGKMKVWEITVYLLILGNSLMFSRVEFFFLVRNIGFAIIIIWLSQKIFSLRSLI